MAETLRVLRDTFDRNSEQLKEVETFLSAIAKHVYPTQGVDAVPTDRDDNRVLECALKASSDTIVSGDGDLLRLGEFRGIRILKAAQFLAEFQTRAKRERGRAQRVTRYGSQANERARSRKSARTLLRRYEDMVAIRPPRLARGPE